MPPDAVAVAPWSSVPLKVAAWRWRQPELTGLNFATNPGYSMKIRIRVPDIVPGNAPAVTGSPLFWVSPPGEVSGRIHGYTDAVAGLPMVCVVISEWPYKLE
jgi:hypothetical protein